jgi:hypothetical protein
MILNGLDRVAMVDAEDIHIPATPPAKSMTGQDNDPICCGSELPGPPIEVEGANVRHVASY